LVYSIYYFYGMVKQNYLNIYPGSGIAVKLNEEDPDDRIAVRQLIADVNLYLKSVDEETLKYHQAREKQQITSIDTYRFFRGRERSRNSRLILQYLVTFLKKIPLQEDIEENVVNPFDQLKSFIRFHTELLKESDVANAILREHERLGLLTEANTWYYRGQINKNYKQLLEVLDNADTISIQGYCKLFEALQRLCLFWFSVRNENKQRVRRSDIFAYRLTRVLMARNCGING